MERRLTSAAPAVDGIGPALRRLFAALPPNRRRAVLPLVALMLCGAAAEVVTIGALIPFLAVIAKTDSPWLHDRLTPLLAHIGADTTLGIMVTLTALFALMTLVAAGLRLALLWATQRFVYGLTCELDIRLYADTLQEPYIVHTRRNSSEIIAAINKVQILAASVLAPLLQGTVALVIATFIIGGLIAIDPTVAVAAGSGFTAVYLIVSTVVRKRLKANGRIVARTQGERVKVMQEGLGGIRDVLIDRSQPVFVESYARAETLFRDARVKIGLFANGPHFVVEAAGMILIAVMAVVVSGRPGGLMAAIPVLGALALGAQRLLPLMQQIYGGWAQVMGNRQVLLDVLALLDRAPAVAVTDGPALPFSHAITLAGVGYAYVAGRAPALEDINLKIAKGARIGIAGKTGSGKSTLMDVILGLLEATTGEIRIDGTLLDARTRPAWQRNIAHVPQFIYLADATIAENIAFGVRRHEIDHDRVRRAAQQAELSEVIADLPDGLDTRIGERGIQLSGGQRQRVGIARALYKQATVLVFDEATSALDNETERAVMAAIDRLDADLTILIIAHRLSTLEGCDTIVRLEAGSVVEDAQGTRPLVAAIQG